MTGKQFYDWQTRGGTDDVMRLVDCLERADVAWCVIGGVAVNHWAQQPMVTQDSELYPQRFGFDFEGAGVVFQAGDDGSANAGGYSP